jgi:hypothetical protein
LVPVGASSRVAVSSVATATNTSEAPAAAAGAVSRNVTRNSVRVGDTPSERDASSSVGGTWARPDRRFTIARGMNIST